MIKDILLAVFGTISVYSIAYWIIKIAFFFKDQRDEKRRLEEKRQRDLDDIIKAFKNK